MMGRGLTIRFPQRDETLFDPLWPCVRCGWEGWHLSELSREEQTHLLVCPPCLDPPIPFRKPEKYYNNDIFTVKVPE